LQQDLAFVVDWILPVVYFEDIIPADFVIPGTRRVKKERRRRKRVVCKYYFGFCPLSILKKLHFGIEFSFHLQNKM
jgi:hypothetical protein